MNPTEKNRFFLPACIFLCLFLILFSLNTIDLTTADLGRHIANGKIFLNSSDYGISQWNLLHSNVFSYTYPDFPFINHHWLSGILSNIVFQTAGFGGLSVIYFLFILGTMVLVMFAVKNHVGITSILLSSIFFIPLLAARVEVRPEGLSYLLLSVFFFILYRYSKGEMDKKWLWLLPALQLLWVNSHIYFIFGIFLIGVFLFEQLILKNWSGAKTLAITWSGTTLASLLNPYGLQGFLYPFTIFRNYGYRVVENQSIGFLENLHFTNPEFLWYKIALALVILSSILVLWKERRAFPISLFILTGVFAVLGFIGIRYIPLFALFSLPLLAVNLTTIRNHFRSEIRTDLKILLYTITFSALILAVTFQFSRKLPWNRDFGLGIDRADLSALEFIKQTEVHGPFFNNYDIGGYMIFGLFPEEKVFVDNRPEAYPQEFWSDVYISMQENEEVWQKELEKEKFNAIFFYRLDYTPWAQKFLIARVEDPSWAPVYVDGKTIIFLRRNGENKGAIEKHELPKEMFKTSS